jgi:hypothetical protein
MSRLKNYAPGPSIQETTWRERGGIYGQEEPAMETR